MNADDMRTLVPPTSDIDPSQQVGPFESRCSGGADLYGAQFFFFFFPFRIAFGSQNHSEVKLHNLS